MPGDSIDSDEVVGSDKLTNKLTEPSQKKTVYDYWNAGMRGFVPGGLNRKGDSSAPVLPDGGDDAEPFSETPVTVVQPDETKRPDAVPVVILDDLTRIAGSVEKYFNTYQITVGNIGNTKIVERDKRRIRVTIEMEEVGDGILWIGATESVGRTGFPLINTQRLVLETSREVWATWEPAAAVLSTRVFVVVEYEKEI